MVRIDEQRAASQGWSVLGVARMPGAGAETVASQVTEPIEQAVINVPDLDGTQSSSSNSMSLIFAEFDFGTDPETAVDDVEQSLGSATLPADVEPMVMSFSIDQMPALTATIGTVPGADPVEAASRTMKTTSAGHIEGMVNDIVMARFRDGQLDDAKMTLAELTKVKRSFVFTLTNMLHGRVPYPKDEDTDKQQPKAASNEQQNNKGSDSQNNGQSPKAEAQ